MYVCNISTSTIFSYDDSRCSKALKQAQRKKVVMVQTKYSFES